MRVQHHSRQRSWSRGRLRRLSNFVPGRPSAADPPALDGGHPSAGRGKRQRSAAASPFLERQVRGREFRITHLPRGRLDAPVVRQHQKRPLYRHIQLCSVVGGAVEVDGGSACTDQMARAGCDVAPKHVPVTPIFEESATAKTSRAVRGASLSRRREATNSMSRRPVCKVQYMQGRYRQLRTQHASSVPDLPESGVGGGAMFDLCKVMLMRCVLC